MERGTRGSLRRVLALGTALVFTITGLPCPPARAATAEELLADPGRADPFTTDVTQLREGLFETLKQQERAIVQKHVRETGVPWTDSAGEVYTHHPRYEQAVKEYGQAWQQHMERVRALDAAVREQGMTRVLDRAKELARKDGVTIPWSEEFKPTGTDPWKGRGTYTDAEYTGTDRANRYVRQALQEKGMTVSATPGQNNVRVKSWDLQLWGEEGKGKIHRAFEAENPEFAKTAMPGGTAGPADKQMAALESLKKAHLDDRVPPPGTWREYQRMNDLVKAVERGEQNVLGKPPADPGIQELRRIRSMETDPVAAGLRKLGDERGLQNPRYEAFQKTQMERMSQILKSGQEANQTFLADLDQKIRGAEAKGDLALANELKTFKNQSLQQQILLRKSLVNELGSQRFAETVEGTKFELVRDPDAGSTLMFRNKETGQTMTKLEMIEKYRGIVKDVEAAQLAGKGEKYRNLATKELITGKDLLERSRQVLKNLEEGKYAEAVKLTEHEPLFQKGKGGDVKRAEYEVISVKGTGGQKMYRNVKTGEVITEAAMRDRYVKKPVEALRKQMSDLGPKPPAAGVAADDLSFRGLDEKAFKPFKTTDLPKIKEHVLPPARAKNLKLVYRYAKLAEQYFQKQYPQLGSRPRGAFWLADPAEAMEEYLLEAEREMSGHPEVLKAFRAAKKEILQQYVRTQLRHQKDAVLIAQEEYVKAAKERSVLRARKMARDAAFNESLQKMMLTLLVSSKLVDFMQTWYDEGFDGLVRKSVSFLTLEVPLGLAVKQGLGLLIPYLAMNAPGLQALLQGVLAYTGAAGVGMMVFTIGRGIAYMTTDYFILDENRQTLLRSLCPLPPKKTNPWDLWSWLAEKRRVDVEKDFSPILEALTSPNTRWTTAMSDIQEYAAQLIVMYRIWLLENYDYVRRLRYFEDDPKVWNVMTGELAKRIWLAHKAEEFKEAQEDEARAQREWEDAFFAEPPQEVPRELRGVIYKVRLNGTTVESYFTDFGGWDDYTHRAAAPRKLKAGDEMKVDVEYAMFGLPGDKLKLKLRAFSPEGDGAAGEAQALYGGQGSEKEATADEAFGLVTGAAAFSLPLQYPSPRKDPNGELAASSLRFELEAEGTRLFAATVENAFTVDGPGTDFNGKGNLRVTVKADPASVKDVPIGDLPDVTIKLEPLSGQKETPKRVTGMYLNGAHTFENIPLGRWRVVAALEKKEIESAADPAPGRSVGPSQPILMARAFWGEKEAFAAEYAGAGKGEKIVTLFMPRPMAADVPLEKRHAGDFQAEVELGKFDVKDFIRVGKQEMSASPWNILALVQDQQGRPVIGAEVKVLGGGGARAEEIGDGRYVLKGLSTRGSVRVGAEVSVPLALAVGTGRYSGETEVTFNGASQENVTIVIPGLSQHKWLIRGTARYSDGTPITLGPDDTFTVTMGMEEKYPKSVSGLSYSFGPFPVPPDTHPEDPASDSNNRGLRAEIRRGGTMIAVASGTVLRKGSERTEYDIVFQAALKNVIEPGKGPPRFVSATQPQDVSRAAAFAPGSVPGKAEEEPLPDATTGPKKSGKIPAPAFVKATQGTQGAVPAAAPVTPSVPETLSPPAPVPPVPAQPVQPAVAEECRDADGRPTLFCNTFDGDIQ